MKKHLGIQAAFVLSLWGVSLAPIASLSSWAGQAQPVPIPEDPSTSPQIEISGVGVATANYGRTGEHPKAEAGINLSDSAIQVGAAQRLYNGGVGSLVFGGVTTDETVQGHGNSLFLYRAFADYQSESFEALLGRSDNPSAHVVDFPTLRGDDLITLLNPLNPFSDGKISEEHRYSNLASITFNQGMKFYENFHAQHLISSADIGPESGINSFGASFEYLAPVASQTFETIPTWGLSYEHLILNAESPGGLHQLSTGGVINLNESVVNRWDLRVQDILSLGSDLKSFQSVTDTYQADSNSVAASVRYLHSPFGRPGSQLALTAAYKTYFDVSDAKSWGLALTAVKRLGQGFDLVAQYQGQWRGGALAEMQSSGVAYEQTVELGFIFDFSATFNEHISPRRSILNQRHQYLPN